MKAKQGKTVQKVEETRKASETTDHKRDMISKSLESAKMELEIMVAARQKMIAAAIHGERRKRLRRGKHDPIAVLTKVVMKVVVEKNYSICIQCRPEEEKMTNQRCLMCSNDPRARVFITTDMVKLHCKLIAIDNRIAAFDS
jgi:hypothetical protein